MSKRFKKLSHTIYECKYHTVICPKYRLRIFADEIAEYTRQQSYILCSQKELVEILEFNNHKDHIHIGMWIPPKYPILAVIGFLKGKL
jgi:putative transposase